MRTVMLNSLQQSDEVAVHGVGALAQVSIVVDEKRREYIISIILPKGGRDLLEIVGFDGELGR